MDVAPPPPRSSSRPRSVAFAARAGERDSGGDGGDASASATPQQQAQQQSAAAESSSLWGPEAVRALRAPRALADAVPDEALLLAAVRRRVGPYALEAALRHHVRNSQPKTHWISNSYLREAVLARADAGAADFEPAAHAPRRGAEAADAAAAEDDTPRACDDADADAAAAAPLAPVPALPPALWELVLARLSAPDVRRAAQCCRALRSAAASAPLWRSLYLSRWGAAAAASATSACSLAAPPLCWRAAYAQRSGHLGALRCPCCAASGALTAIVYGFPSVSLVTCQREGRVLLGGDYLLENDPAWACAACGLQWRAWPWQHGGPPPACAPAGRVAAAGAGAGVHFAADL